MKKHAVLLFLISLVVWLNGCSTFVPSVTPTEGTSPTPTLTTPTPLPPTSTSLPPVVVLLASQDVDPALIGEVQPFVSSWAEEEGFRFQSLETLSEGDFEEEAFRLVVVLPPYPDLGSLVGSAPDIPFLAVGFSDVESGENLSVILPGRDRYDQHGFIGGYLAAMVTPEWRVGAIGVKGDEAAEQARRAFTLGVRYFCGMCLPDYPPYEYPLIVELDPDAGSSIWQTSADVLIKKGVETFYIVPGAGDEQLLRFLLQRDIRIIADGGEYADDLQEVWVASLEFDLVKALKDTWPDFVSGDVGGEIPVSLSITDVNPELLSPGRLRNAESILQEVEEGWIQTEAE
ncbi:MAG: hypothetical protein R6U57_01650 [Anaerolineales bacterium]